MPRRPASLIINTSYQKLPFGSGDYQHVVVFSGRISYEWVCGESPAPLKQVSNKTRYRGCPRVGCLLWNLGATIVKEPTTFLLKAWVVPRGMDAKLLFRDRLLHENSHLKASVLLNPGKSMVPLPPPNPAPHHSRRPPSSTRTNPCWKREGPYKQVTPPPIHAIFLGLGLAVLFVSAEGHRRQDSV